MSSLNVPSSRRNSTIVVDTNDDANLTVPSKRRNSKLSDTIHLTNIQEGNEKRNSLASTKEVQFKSRSGSMVSIETVRTQIEATFDDNEPKSQAFSAYCIGVTLFILVSAGIFIPIHIFILNSELEVEKCTVDPLIIGDELCHDVANEEICQHDGGDCCKTFVNKTFCKECRCHESAKVHVDPLLKNKGAWYEELTNHFCVISWIGDGICQKANNFDSCHFDGGDCCLSSIFSTHMCKECSCLHGNDEASKNKYCLNDFSKIGNGVCDWKLHTEPCYFDDNDCYQDLLNLTFVQAIGRK